jgi:leucyl-tRNA synthetase
VVNPDEYIATYGCDALRLYLMFMGPFDQGGDFRDTAMEGMSRWVGRIWRLGESILKKETASTDKVASAMQKLIKKLSDDMEKRRYNTGIASMMEFTNLVADEGNAISKKDYVNFLLLLAPFAPHVTEELYQQMRGQKDAEFTKELSIHTQAWPTFDLSGIKEESVTIVVQINGKVRDTLMIASEKKNNQSELETLARAAENVKKNLKGKKVIKVIFVPGKLLNFVVV